MSKFLDLKSQFKLFKIHNARNISLKLFLPYMLNSLNLCYLNHLLIKQKQSSFLATTISCYHLVSCLMTCMSKDYDIDILVQYHFSLIRNFCLKIMAVITWSQMVLESPLPLTFYK